MVAEQEDCGLPSGLSAPARRALASAGVSCLEDLTRLREDEVLLLHGMGPKAIEQLRSPLTARELSFARNLQPE